MFLLLSTNLLLYVLINTIGGEEDFNFEPQKHFSRAFRDRVACSKCLTINQGPLCCVRPLSQYHTHYTELRQPAAGGGEAQSKPSIVIKTSHQNIHISFQFW